MEPTTTVAVAPTCPTPTCPASARSCSPACNTGYECRLSVIEATCQCPVASCVKIDFDTGVDSGSSGSTSGGSVVGPIVGSIAGLGAVALIAFFVVRRRRRRRRAEVMMMLGQDDSSDSFPKRWDSTISDPTGKDVIRIAYIPSMIGDSPIVTPESSAQHGGVLIPNFTSLSEEHNKHDSVSFLDEAVVMAVTTKATPQVMKLNAIKASQSDLIQRSNSLHSSNSIKRSQSQRRFAGKAGDKTPSPLRGAHSETDSDMESSDVDGATSAVRVRKASAASAGSDNDHEANPFMTDVEKADNTHGNNATNIQPSRLSNPFLSPSESKALTLNLDSPTTSFVTSQSGTPMSDRTVFSSIPLTLVDHQGDPLSDLAEGGVKLRPWATSSGPTALRDSTFSTLSDSRSSTRGDGEEIMIFWDGHRDSKANL